MEILAALAVLVAGYLGSAAVLGFVPVNRGFAPSPEGVELCVRSNGVHADYVVPVAHAVIDWRSQHPAAHFPVLAGEYGAIAFGWGERRFYLETPTWAELKLGTALAAATGLGDAALHVEFSNMPSPGDRVVCTRISETQYRTLADYIRGSFKRDASGAVMRVDAAGYGPADAFYEGNGTFSVFVTCNEWVRRGLSESGIRAPAWAPFDGALLNQLRAAAEK